MKVPFFNYKKLYSESKNDFLEIIDKTFSKGSFIMQEELFEFEKKLADYLGVKHAIGLADGTTAIVFSLKANNIKPGDEVIISTHTFIATASAIKSVNAIPVICDCNSDGLIDPKCIEDLITEKTVAIMPTQLNGRICDMNEIEVIAKKRNLKIIEDSCQALGAEYIGRKAGTFGLCGSFSFFPAKTLGCFGDGGALITDNDDVAEFVNKLRDHGRSDNGEVVIWGDNGRLDNIQAAVLSYKLDFYSEYLHRRREIASMYQERLGDLNRLQLPPQPDFESNNRFDIYQNYEILAEERDELKKYLHQNNIGTIIQWGGWMIHHFKKLNNNLSAPYSDEYAKKMLLLPMNHFLSNDEIEYVSKVIRSFYLDLT